MEYNDKIAKNDKVELIHVSLDSSKDEALTWAKQESFPWPHALMESYNDKKSDVAFKKFEIIAVPTYLLVNNKGEIVANGKKDVFEKALAK